MRPIVGRTYMLVRALMGLAAMVQERMVQDPITDLLPSLWRRGV